MGSSSTVRPCHVNTALPGTGAGSVIPIIFVMFTCFTGLNGTHTASMRQAGSMGK